MSKTEIRYGGEGSVMVVAHILTESRVGKIPNIMALYIEQGTTKIRVSNWVDDTMENRNKLNETINTLIRNRGY